MSAITIPDGFFPPPGVPFSSINQIALATTLAQFNMIDLEILSIEQTPVKWHKWGGIGNGDPSNYRLAPPKPRTVGPVICDVEYKDGLMQAPRGFESAWDIVSAQCRGAGLKNYRIYLTATAEEIL